MFLSKNEFKITSPDSAPKHHYFTIHSTVGMFGYAARIAKKLWRYPCFC